ncbi:MAG: ASKHA domain-containing protein [Candidatus Omnitrophota bacterium]
MEKFKVTFYPDNKSITVEKDTAILSAAISCGVYINAVCGGDGVCGKCKVIVKKGKVITQPNVSVTQEEKNNHVYLSCLTTIHSDLEVEIPPQSRLTFGSISPEELEKRLKGLYSEAEEIDPVSPKETGGFTHSPLATKLYLEIPQPDLNDRISDLERLYREIRKTVDIPSMQTGLSNIRQLGELLRDSDWKVTVTLGKRNDTVEIVFIEPADTSGNNLGLAFDIGTTTISGQLIDLNNKKILGTKAAYNKQASFGSDVITRIIYAKEENGLDKLHNAVTYTMNQIIMELTREHSVDLKDVACVLCAGNTTMIHLLLNIDPTYIRREPYVPTGNFLPVVRAAEAGININPRGLLSCVPGVSSYIGGDTTAGVLSSGLYKEEDLSILIDIGTNGEIVLGNKDFFVAAAASAGPAFEGSGLTCGMRASRGAIQKIKIHPKDLSVDFNTIEGAKPRGICGSGYIEMLASMLSCGLLDKNGKIKGIGHKRVRGGKENREFVAVFKEESGTDADIVITEADIENLKCAKAAIYSAVSILAKRMDLNLSQIKKFFIAGGFGTYLDISSAIRIGLLPDLDRTRFFFIGNSALAGARAMLISNQAMKEAERIAGKITYLELSVEPGYMDEYVAALFFPHTDLSRFPSVDL